MEKLSIVTGITGLIILLIIGFVRIFNNRRNIILEYEFIIEFKENFVIFTNNFFKDYDAVFRENKNFNSELYTWLTKNVYKVQNMLGSSGMMAYVVPLHRYKVSNYQIIINTLPKFRNGTIEELDIISVDDCLLRYIGKLEEKICRFKKELKNPLVWFKMGIEGIISIPLYVFSIFGIISNEIIYKIIKSTGYKIINGMMSIVTLIEFIAMIITGKSLIIQLIKNFFS